MIQIQAALCSANSLTCPWRTVTSVPRKPGSSENMLLSSGCLFPGKAFDFLKLKAHVVLEPKMRVPIPWTKYRA